MHERLHKIWGLVYCWVGNRNRPYCQGVQSIPWNEHPCEGWVKGVKYLEAAGANIGATVGADPGLGGEMFLTASSLSWSSHCKLEVLKYEQSSTYPRLILIVSSN